MAKSKRETIGVELYGYQQGLAKLQMQLETTHQTYQAICSLRTQSEAELAELRKHLDDDTTTTKVERSRVDKHQLELDRLGATLKQIEAYNEQMKSEVAATRRAAYAAEGAVQLLEKQKLEQDLRIDAMQEDLKTVQHQLQLHTAQLEAQKRETRAAMETLAEAESEMESVQFEKKQLMAQWKSSLNAIQKRDEALSAIKQSLTEQQENERSMEAEFTGYKKDILKQQVQNEQLTSVLKKVEGESLFVGKQIEAFVEKQDRLQEVSTSQHL
jgi:chromosome segregation ATPase